MRNEISSIIAEQEGKTKRAYEKFEQAIARHNKEAARKACKEWCNEAAKLNVMSDIYLR